MYSRSAWTEPRTFIQKSMQKWKEENRVEGKWHSSTADGHVWGVASPVLLPFNGGFPPNPSSTFPSKHYS